MIRCPTSVNAVSFEWLIRKLLLHSTCSQRFCADTIKPNTPRTFNGQVSIRRHPRTVCAVHPDTKHYVDQVWLAEWQPQTAWLKRESRPKSCYYKAKHSARKWKSTSKAKATLNVCRYRGAVVQLPRMPHTLWRFMFHAPMDDNEIQYADTVEVDHVWELRMNSLNLWQYSLEMVFAHVHGGWMNNGREIIYLDNHDWMGWRNSENKSISKSWKLQLGSPSRRSDRYW